MFKQRESKEQDKANKINPLDEVRQEEAKVASQILLARHDAEAAKQAAVLLAQQRMDEAQQAGLEAGQACRAQAIKETTLEAEAVVEKARVQADAVVQNGRPFISDAAQWAARVVMGLEIGDPKP